MKTINDYNQARINAINKLKHLTNILEDADTTLTNQIEVRTSFITQVDEVFMLDAEIKQFVANSKDRPIQLHPE